MLLSNEPGYYAADLWGIRIENLVVVTPPDAAGFLTFETVTFCPIDRRLIIAQMLTPAERAFVDAYHGQVESLLMPGLADDAESVRAWLRAACAPL